MQRCRSWPAVIALFANRPYPFVATLTISLVQKIGQANAIKVQTKGLATDVRLERVIALMDDLFAIDRQAREQNL